MTIYFLQNSDNDLARPRTGTTDHQSHPSSDGHTSQRGPLQDITTRLNRTAGDRIGQHNRSAVNNDADEDEGNRVNCLIAMTNITKIQTTET